MDSGMVSKIEKSIRYAEERDRVRFQQFEVVFRGDHNSYKVQYDHGRWRCECHFFSQRGVCSHTMALERIMNGMLAEEDTSQ
jgi:hypothetical protein